MTVTVPMRLPSASNLRLQSAADLREHVTMLVTAEERGNTHPAGNQQPDHPGGPRTMSTTPVPILPPWLTLIRDRIGEVSDRALAVEAGVSKTSVAAWRKRLGIAPPQLRSWSAAEEEELRRAYGTARCNEELDLHGLAGRIGRSYASVTLKANDLGLTCISRPNVLHRKVRQPMFSTREDRSAATSARIKALWAERGHPRGALGLRHTPETLAVLSEKSKATWAAPDSVLRSDRMAQLRSDNTMRMMLTRPAEQQHTRAAGGRRPDLDDRYFRSSWEANYARWLNFLVKQGNIRGWEYEPTTFIFHTISRGTRSYKPDFRVDLPSGGYEWHEVKGWMDPKSKVRLDRMARHYPEERIIIIGKDWFADANRKVGRLLPGWETPSARRA